jgi:predicted Zn-dependent protease
MSGNIVGAIALGIILIGCSTAPVTGRRQLKLVSAGQETQLGLSSFEQLKTNTPISHDSAANAMVQRVGKRIAGVAGKDLPDAQWEFVVFESKEANAFCLPGGKVGVYTGLLPIAKDDAGLATVLGHEIGHAVAHHGAERMSNQMVSQGAGQLLGSALDPKWQGTFLSLYGAGSQVALELPHDRKQESEADHIGIIYMAKAGYDPAEAIKFWQRFKDYNQQQSGGKQASWYSKYLSTHPVDDVRIADLQKLLPEAQAAFAKPIR